MPNCWLQNLLLRVHLKHDGYLGKHSNHTSNSAKPIVTKLDEIETKAETNIIFF